MLAFSRTRLSHWGLLAFLLLNGFVAAMIGFFLLESRAQYSEKAAISAQNLSQLLEQQLNASIRQIDISLRSMGDVVVRALGEGKNLEQQKLYGLLTQLRPSPTSRPAASKSPPSPAWWWPTPPRS